MLNNKINELIQSYSAGARETFIEMDRNLVKATGYELLDNNGLDDILESGSATYKIDDDNWLNVIFEVEYWSTTLTDSVLLIQKVELI